MERAVGNDPTSLRWKHRAQPLDQARSKKEGLCVSLCGLAELHAFRSKPCAGLGSGELEEGPCPLWWSSLPPACAGGMPESKRRRGIGGELPAQ
jgi:hypothetical protein